MQLSTAEASLFFKKYGMDRDGLLPYEPFCRALLSSANRMVGSDKLHEGAYKPGEVVDVDAKVRYRPARKDAITVLPPSDFDVELAKRSCRVPDRGLKVRQYKGAGGASAAARDGRERRWHRHPQ